MSYDYPSKKYIGSTEVDTLATFLAQRQSDSGTTNGGIVATSSPTVPQLGVDALGLGLSYFKAMADAMLSSCATQARFIDTFGPGSSNSTNSGTFVNMPSGTSATITAPLARLYTFDVDITNTFVNVASTVVEYQFLVNGVASLVTTGRIVYSDTNRRGLSFRAQGNCNAGSNTFQLQWRVVSGGGTVTWDTVCGLTVHFRG